VAERKLPHRSSLEARSELASAAGQPVEPEPGTGAARVYTALRAKILNVDLEPGCPIDERAIGAEFGLSRSPVREALIRLSEEGLVVSVSSRRTAVAPLSLEDLPELVLLNNVTARMAARLAATARLQGDVERIAEGLAALAEAQSAQAHDAAARQCRCAIAGASHNQFLVDWIEQIQDHRHRLERHYLRTAPKPSKAAIDACFKRIATAVSSGNATAAEVAAEEESRHFENLFTKVKT
jgi:DNA-binding GntR family transcriptional regulator